MASKTSSYEVVADKNILDQYGHCILQGNAYIEGYYWEYEVEKKGVKMYKQMKKHVYCYCSSVLYPFVNHMQKGKYLPCYK